MEKFIAEFRIIFHFDPKNVILSVILFHSSDISRNVANKTVTRLKRATVLAHKKTPRHFAMPGRFVH